MSVLLTTEQQWNVYRTAPVRDTVTTICRAQALHIIEQLEADSHDPKWYSSSTGTFDLTKWLQSARQELEGK
jgi:hypothetical protein